MIFVTVGSQMGFDRLVTAVDDWAAANGRRDVFAQIGPSSLRPRAVEWARFIEPQEFRERVRCCDVLVAHAGMGSILTALEFGKPILVMPRRGSLQETRNDHQVATARRFKSLGKVNVAMDEHEMPAMLDRLGELRAGAPIQPFASEPLIHAIRSFIYRLESGGQRVEPKAQRAVHPALGELRASSPDAPPRVVETKPVEAARP